MMMMMMNGDVLVPTNPDPSGKWPLKRIEMMMMMMMYIGCMYKYVYVGRVSWTFGEDTNVQHAR